MKLLSALAAVPIAFACAPLVACGDDASGGTTDVAADTSPEVTPDTADDTSEPSDTSGPSDTAEPADTAEPSDTAEPGDTGGGDTGGGDTSAPACVETEPLCSDEQIAQLQLSDEASGGDITTESSEGGVFVTHIDATAGGFNGTLGYTYARFTDAGLEQVDLSDEEALESSDWDIAARRFILRLNSGVSGPSCVLAGRTGPTTEFDEVTSADGVTLRAEQYFTADGCEYVADTSGIGSPQTVLSSFWSYAGCVAMTGNVYVVQLADGRHVKLQVLSYYSPDVQETCDETDEAPTPNGSGNVRIQWAFID